MVASNEWVALRMATSGGFEWRGWAAQQGIDMASPSGVAQRSSCGSVTSHSLCDCTENFTGVEQNLCEVSI